MAWYRYTIQSTRLGTGVRQPNGELNFIPFTVLNGFLCDIQEKSSGIQYVGAGQEEIDEKILLCDSADIQPEDRITVLSTPTGFGVGFVYKVTSVPDVGTLFSNKLSVEIKRIAQ